MTPPLYARCGLDLVHDPHPNADDSQCDGGVTLPAASTFAGLYSGLTGTPKPWAWASLTVDQARQLVDALDGFAEHYNRTYVVDERLLILGCWPLHPGLAAELAALYAQYVNAHQGGMATAETSVAWHDRWLPGFQQRLPGWYGLDGQGCRPGDHKPSWNPSTARLVEAAKRPEGVEVDDVVRALVASPAHLEV